MNPTEKDQDDDRAVPPKVESYNALRTRILKEALDEERTAPSEDAIIMLHSSLCKEAEIDMELYREKSQKEQAIRNLIMTTVSLEIYKDAMYKATTYRPKPNDFSKTKPKHTLRQLLRVLQQVMALPQNETKMNIVKEYHELYNEAGRDGLSYNQFHVKWPNIMRKALDCMAPIVAAYSDDEEDIKVMRIIEFQSRKPPSDRRVTFGGETDWTRDASGLFLCPCFKQKHAWTPEKCGNVRWAITGRPVKGIKKPSAGQVRNIRHSMRDPKWAEIQVCYIMQGHQHQLNSY